MSENTDAASRDAVLGELLIARTQPLSNLEDLACFETMFQTASARGNDVTATPKDAH